MSAEQMRYRPRLLVDRRCDVWMAMTEKRAHLPGVVAVVRAGSIALRRCRWPHPVRAQHADAAS
jgi:hypothetical protein